MATTTAAERKLTPKQKQVLGEIRKGKEIPDIAKKMGITTSGVYGHIRQIRKAGVSVTQAALEAQAEATPNANGNGHAEANDPVREFLVNAILDCEQQADESAKRAELLSEEVRAAEEQEKLQRDRLGRLHAAHNAL